MITIEQQPRLADPGAVDQLVLQLRTGTEQAADHLRAALAEASPGRMGSTWQVKRLPGVGVLGWGVTTLHPGARPLNDSAHWPGKMPPWGPGTPLADWATSHGIPPFLVARALQRRGGFAPDFGGQYESFVDRTVLLEQSTVRDLVQRQGIRTFLERISRGG